MLRKVGSPCGSIVVVISQRSVTAKFYSSLCIFVERLVVVGFPLTGRFRLLARRLGGYSSRIILLHIAGQVGEDVNAAGVLIASRIVSRIIAAASSSRAATPSPSPESPGH